MAKKAKPASPFTGRWRIVSMNEMDPCTDRGWAVLEGDDLHGMIFFHPGEESGFVARRAPKRRRPRRK